MAPSNVLLEALTYLVIDGITHQAGDIFELPEPQAMGLVGTGAAREIPPEQSLPGPPLATFVVPVTAEMGSKSIPIQFPRPAILLWTVHQVKKDFIGGPTDAQVSIGSAAGRNDILTANGMGQQHTITIHPVQHSLPFEEDPNPYQAFVNFDAMDSTEGEGSVILIYAGM